MQNFKPVSIRENTHVTLSTKETIEQESRFFCVTYELVYCAK